MPSTPRSSNEVSKSEPTHSNKSISFSRIFLVYKDIYKHNIIRIHDNLMWDYKYSMKYFWIFPIFSLSPNNQPNPPNGNYLTQKKVLISTSPFWGIVQKCGKYFSRFQIRTQTIKLQAPLYTECLMHYTF